MRETGKQREKNEGNQVNDRFISRRNRKIIIAQSRSEMRNLMPAEKICSIKSKNIRISYLITYVTM